MKAGNLKSLAILFVLMCVCVNASASTVEDFFTVLNGATISVVNDATYPWIVNESGEMVSNMHVNGAKTTISFTNTLSSPVICSFKWKKIGEGGCDYIYYDIDGTQQTSNTTDNGDYASISTILGAGQYLSFTYCKDGSVTNSPDCGYVKDLLFEALVGTTFNISADQTFVSSSLFTGWSSLENITVDDNNSYYSSVNGVLFNKDKTQLIAYPAAHSGISYTVPNSVTTICTQAFYNNKSLASVTIPENVTSIYSEAFSGCSNLKNITISGNPTYGTNAFAGVPNKLCGVNTSGIYTDANGSEWGYSINSACDSVNITSYKGTDLALIVPDNVVLNGFNYPVKSIGSSVFSGNTNLTSVTFPSTLKNIGSSAFYYCTSLASITLPEGVTTIENSLFYHCTSLENITLPAGISTIGSSAFSYCTSLENITLPAGISTIGSSAFSYCTSLENITLPEGITTIGASAFNGCSGLTSVTLPSTVTTIGNSAFNSSTLEKFVLGDTPATLGSTTPFCSTALFFVPDAQVDSYKSAWTDLASRIYPISTLSTEVNTTAVDGRSGLLDAIGGVGTEENYVSLKVNGTINGYDIMVLRNKMTNLRYLDLSDATIVPESSNYEYYTGHYTTSNVLGDYSFKGVDNLRSIVLPKNIISIGSYALANCTKLSSVTGMPKSCKSIGSNAFYYDTMLYNITIGDSVQTIGSNAFYDCYNLNTVNFAEGLTSIGFYAFYSCGKLKDLKLPSSLTTIESCAFRYCSSLKDIHIPSMVESIGDYAFQGCGTQNVYAYTLNPISISQNTFDYDGVTLNAPQNPDEVFWAYYNNTQWSQFTNVKPFEAKYSNWYTGENEDVTVADGETIPNEDGQQATGEMRPGSGLVYEEGAYQWLDKLNLKWKGGKFPSLIENSNVFVDELTFLLTVNAGKWYFFCFPFDIDLTKCNFNGKYIWRYYDGDERAKSGKGGWKNITEKKLKAGQGYIFQTNKAGDIELNIASPEMTGSDKSVAIEAHAAASAQDASWNFIGNPNMSYYDISDLAKNYNCAITVWNATNNTYDAVMPGDDDYQFHPFEAFFIQKPDSKDEVKFEAAYRQTCNGAEKAASAKRLARAKRAIDKNRLIVNVAITDGNMTDKTRVIFNDSKSADYETECDASKFMSSEAVPQIYTLDSKNVKYAINERPNSGRTVKLGYKASVEGTYTITAQRQDCAMALKDNVTGATHDLSLGDYEFQSKAGSFDDRFTLVPASDYATGINGASAAGFAVAAVEGGINFSGMNGKTATVYDANGASVAVVTENGEVAVPAGVYVVTTGNNSRKVVVK